MRRWWGLLAACVALNGAVAASASSSGSGSSDTSGMQLVTAVHARVQSDAPQWDAEHETFVSSFGDSFAERYRAAFDTINTASVEGALMYVQAEGINVQDNPGCARKNDMAYVVFYAVQIRQTDATMFAYDTVNGSNLPEFGPFVAMDSGACTLDGLELPVDCLALFGGQQDQVGSKMSTSSTKVLDVGPAVGAGRRETDARAPYPDTIWFSLPNSCVMETWAHKNSTCRKQYTGGLCAFNTPPDGVACTFTYKTLGFLRLDELVGITNLTSSLTGKPYTNYTEFCNDRDGEYQGVEFSVDDDLAPESVVSIPFWADPFNETACAARTSAMIDMYNNVVVPADSRMTALPEISSLTNANPPCYQNSPKCVRSKYGCKRELYSQVCTVCEGPEEGCVGVSYTFDEVG